jgi:hypothetical protein
MTSEKPTFPTTTTHTIRLCLFQATRRPKRLNKHEIATPWGRVRVSGRLGQQHADVFEAICYEREKKAVMEDGRIKLLVDPYRVMKRARVRSWEQFNDIVHELREATIEIMEPVHLACVGGLIDHADKAMKADGTPITRHNPLTGGERYMWRVEIGKAFCKLVAGDVWVGYDPAAIAALDHGISQAVARHVLSHQTQPVGGWRLDTLIEAVSGPLDSVAMRHRRRELREDAEALRGVGIVIDGERVCRDKGEQP